jgi:hypothetical protein
MISGGKGAWKEGPFNEAKEVIVAYYILAKDLDEAVGIAKGNPEFEDWVPDTGWLFAPGH